MGLLPFVFPFVLHHSMAKQYLKHASQLVLTVLSDKTLLGSALTDVPQAHTLILISIFVLLLAILYYLNLLILQHKDV